MKRILPLISMVLVFFGVLCACSSGPKAYEVVETNIQALENDPWQAPSFERDYDELSEKDKEKVSNYADLQQALAEIDEMREYTGTWVCENPVGFTGDQFTIGEDGLTEIPFEGVSGQSWIRDGMFLFAGEEKGSVIEEDGFHKIILKLSEDFEEVFVQDFNLAGAQEAKYVAVDFANADVSQYFDDAVLLTSEQNYIYCLPNKQYENGLVYLGESDDFCVTYNWKSLITDETFEYETDTPFVCIFSGSSTEVPAEIVPIRAKGILYFVRSEYVDANYFEDGYRFLSLTCGETIRYSNLTENWGVVPEYYDDHKF